MTYNSEITILNSTPERGTVTGKRMRLSGTSGKVYAKVIDKIYKFERWETFDGQEISTTNPLTIDNWGPQVIRVVFGHVMLTDQMFSDHDAIATQTSMLEHHGHLPRDEWFNGNTTSKFYSQKNIAGPTTRVTSYGKVIPTYEKPYGYSHLEATYDPGTNTSTGTWYRDPATTDFSPASGFKAEDYCLFRSPKFRRTTSSKWLNTSASVATFYYGTNNHTSNTYYNYSMWGLWNNPTAGESTRFPMWNWMPYNYLYTNGTPEFHDDTGLEYGNINVIYDMPSGTPNYYASTNNLDAMMSNPVLRLHSDGSRGLVCPDSVYLWNVSAEHAQSYNQSFNGAPPTLHDTSGTKTSPRLIESLGYTPLNTLSLRAQYYFNSTLPFSGPQDTQADPVTKKPKNNPHWVTKWQSTPHSGSVLWSLRYTDIADLRIHSSTAIADFSAWQFYGKNLKHLIMDDPTYYSSDRLWSGQSWKNINSLKSLKEITWYDSWSHASFDITEPFDWSGINKLTNLRSLYINHPTDQYVKSLNLSDIPPNVTNLYIKPTAYLSEDIHPGETVTGRLAISNNQIVDESRYSELNTIKANNLNIISTS